MHARGWIVIGAVTLAHALPAVRALGQAAPRVSAASAAAAGFILAAAFMCDEGVRREVQAHAFGEGRSMVQAGNALGDPRYVFPVLGATYVAGALSGNAGLRRAALRAGAAAFVASGITTALKDTIGRRRPGSGDDADWFRPFSGWNSFPSGHTTFAFAVATAIAAETPDRWTDAALYGAATLTAFARVHTDRHWTSDVLVGALVGHLTARWLARRPGWLTVRPGIVGAALEF